MDPLRDPGTENLDVLPVGTSLGYFAALVNGIPGRASSNRVLYPSLSDDGSIATDESDGEVLGPFAAEFGRCDRTAVLVNLSAQRKREWLAPKFELIVTANRIAYRTTRPAADGTFQAGHLRYSWISSVAFRPRQGILIPCTLTVDTNLEVADESTALKWITVSFDFPRVFDSGTLAQKMVQRAARHALAQPGRPAAALNALQELVGVAKLPDPPKKDLATYDIAAYRLWPGSTEWTGPGPSSDS
jgi:hypothetical protein